MLARSMRRIGSAGAVVLAAVALTLAGAPPGTTAAQAHPGAAQSGAAQSGATQSGATQSGTTQSGTTQPGTTMRVALTQDIDSLNPFVAVFLSSTQINRLMYEYLTVAGPDNAVAPGLAESWEPSADKLTWTFRIRDAQWSDGRPIRAQDVAFTYNLIMSNPAAQEANGGAVANYATVTATDDRTLVITTEQPQASILNSEIPIVPEHVWAPLVGEIDTFTNTDPLPAVGSGPFVLTGYQEGQSVTLRANDTFWRGRPKVDTLQFVKYENTDAAVQGLIKGDLDLVRDTTPAQFGVLADNPTIGRNEGRNRRFVEVLANWSNPGPDGQPFGDGHPALRDVQVRRALHHAIDVDAIVERIKQGHAEPAHSIIPPVFPDWTFTPSAQQQRGHDPERAEQLLDEAGYRPGPDGIRVGPDGRPLALRLVVATDKATNRQLAEFMVGWFAAVGVGLTPEFKSSNQADDDMVAGSYDLAFSGWSVGPDPDPMLSQQTCAFIGTAQSDSGYCNPEYDRLYAQQQAELDQPRRQEIVQQMQSMLYDDVSALVLTHDTLLEAYRADRFTGFVTQPEDGGVISGQTGYWGYYSATPVAGTGAAAAADDGGNTGAVVGGVVAGVVVLGLLGLLLLRRRRAGSDERE